LTFIESLNESKRNKLMQTPTIIYNNTGIYKIANKLNPNLYVGSAVDLKNHWTTYKRELNQNIFHNDHLQKAWNKYGPDAFEYIHLEYTTLKQLDMVWSEKHQCMLIQPEQNWIDKYWDSGLLYNTCPIAGSRKGTKNTCSEETKKKISEGTKNKPKSEEHKKKIGDSNSKITWQITFPNGEIKIIKNLRKFCRDNNLNHGHMLFVSTGKRKHHKGFKCKNLGTPGGI
jgi:group I intron endonuclease